MSQAVEPLVASLYSLLCVNGCLIAGVTLELNGNPVINFGLLAHNDIGTSDDFVDVGGNLVCRTDLTTCCTGADGLVQGQWYYPTGGLVLFNFQGALPSGQIYRFRRGTQVVRIRRDPNVNIADTANGIYHCEVADQNGVTQTRYVGLYTEGAGEYKFGIIIVLCCFYVHVCRCRCGINI